MKVLLLYMLGVNVYKISFNPLNERSTCLCLLIFCNSVKIGKVILL